MLDHRRLTWVGLTAAAMLAVPVGSIVTRAADAPETAKPKIAKKGFAKKNAAAGNPSGDRREAAEILKAFQTIAAAVDKEESATETTPINDFLKQLARPERSVKAPTLDAKGLDALIDKKLAADKTSVARQTSDEEFIRRVTLDVTGKLPTPDQVRAFVQSRKPNKRSDLINQLLDSPDYASNWARYWRDVVKFRATADNPRLMNFPKLEEWLTEQFAAKTPWDQISKSMITATGTTEDNGATVFTAAHMAMPNEVAGEVSRVFLGVQIQCAECHDHPSDIWKREQFHQFAAFFAGVQARRRLADGTPGLTIATRGGKPRYTMPDLKDPQKSIPVEPRFFLASSEAEIPAKLTAQQRRELAADLVTGQDNPWFAKSFVNRIWYAFMGDGFYNPVDDLGPTREPNNPEVLEALATQFQQSGYDIPWLFRTILNTKAYQREARSSSSVVGRTPLAANCPSRLRSDQIYDALQSVGVRLEPPAGMRRGAAGAGNVAGAAILRRIGPRGLFDTVFGVDPSTPNEDVLGTIPQALFLMNSPPIHAAVQARPGTLLGEILAATPDNRAALEALYLKVLSRRPNAKEVEICGNYMMHVGNRREAFEDIFWGLLNSTEFLSRR